MVIMILLDNNAWGGSINTSTLRLTLGLIPTVEERGWFFVPVPQTTTVAMVLASFIAGLLFYTIIFIETEAAQ